MKLLTFEPRIASHPGHRLGLLYATDTIVDVALAAEAMALRSGPTDMLTFLEGASLTLETAREILLRVEDYAYRSTAFVFARDQVTLRAPLARPRSLRLFHGFKEHERLVHEVLGRDFPEEWSRAPIFEFINHQAIYGPGQGIPAPGIGRELDCECTIACVIGRAGMNIAEEDASNFIFGYTLAIHWVMRDVQKLEFSIGAGPSKSRDFATFLGPSLVTCEEFPWSDPPKQKDVRVSFRINGEKIMAGRIPEPTWPITSMIACASMNTPLFPGDVVSLGPIPGCSLLAAGKWGYGKNAIRPGDTVEFECEPVGTLTAKVL